MSRTSFTSPSATVVVSTDGYFDVYAPTGRSDGDKPTYRGLLPELGAGLRGPNDRLAVRPNSLALADAVRAWSDAHGEATVRGDNGHGRDGTEAAA